MAALYDNFLTSLQSRRTDKRGRQPKRADKAHSAVLTSGGLKDRSVL